jgi:cytochrome P450
VCPRPRVPPWFAIGFGQGAHACAGQALARLETIAMLRALLERVDRIELTGSPTWAINNIIHRMNACPSS